MDRIIRKSTTIKIKINGGKSPKCEISHYTTLTNDDLSSMTKEERIEYLNSEHLVINGSFVPISELTSSIAEVIKKIGIEEISQLAIIFK
jgi:hypothetical protein